MVGVLCSCVLLGGFAVGTRVSLLWRHTAEHEMSASAWTRYMRYARLTLQCLAVLTDDRVSLYFIIGRPFPPSILLLPVGHVDPHLTCVSLGPPKSSTRTASQTVRPFLQGWLVCQTDEQTSRQTDHATRSVTIGRIYVRSAAIRPNNTISG